MGINNTSTYSILRSRARARDRFYDPAIESDVDAAVDYALAEKAQKGKAEKALSALKKDSRHVIAAEIAGIPVRTFYRILEKVQSDFALCLRAYHEYLRIR